MTMTACLLEAPAAPATSVTGSVHSWDISTGVDGPGTRFVVFTAGCPLRCVYCHNPDTWFGRTGQRMSTADVLTLAARYRRFIGAAGGGLTVSGGQRAARARFTASLGNVERVDVLPFHQLGAAKYAGLGLNYPCAEVTPPTAEQVSRARAAFTAAGLQAI